MTEQEAIQLLRKGDVRGLEILVNRHQLKAVRTAYLITRDTGLAQDVVQDCFIAVLRGVRSFDTTRPFAPWFMRSVVNAAVKVMHGAARHVDADVDDEDVSIFAVLVSGTESVEEQVESIEFQSEIWEAMQKLSPRQRAVIVQRYFLGMSEKEMAQESGAAVGTVKWLLNAARERLRMLLAERSDE